jgi:hypothetical protein
MSYVNVSGAVSVAAGTVALPALTFASDLDCGYYRIGANDIGLAINGVKTAEYSATAVTLAPAGTTTLNLAATNAALGQATASYAVRTVNGTDTSPGGFSTVQVATAVATGAVISAAAIRGGIVTYGTASDSSNALTTAALLVAALPGVAVGDTIQFSVVNSAGANTFTITAGSGITVGGAGGAAVVAAATSARFAIRFTNVTASSEAAVLYRLA